jgi:HNH endonuclease
MKTCIYCGKDKPDDAFSDEHIWPDALGGDYLPDLWRTDDVCTKCNRDSGLFVDGSFIKSWPGTAERAFDAMAYLSPSQPGILPLNYLGVLVDAPTRASEIAEYWSGPCGAKIIHIRPKDSEERWASYAGGDPRQKPSRAGRAYIALTSKQVFWICVSLASFKAHFTEAERFVVNREVPPHWRGSFSNTDITNPVQAADMEVVTRVTSAGHVDNVVKAVIELDVGERFLAKVGLAIGYKLLGAPFLTTDYAQNLRRCFREANVERRQQIPLPRTGYLDEIGLGGDEQLLTWPGGWVLLLAVVDQQLVLTVVSPSSRTMSLAVCDKPALVSQLDKAYLHGSIWITIPALRRAVGPIPLLSYLAHQRSARLLPELVALAGQRIDPRTLPPCDANDGTT